MLPLVLNPTELYTYKVKEVYLPIYTNKLGYMTGPVTHNKIY